MRKLLLLLSAAAAAMTLTGCAGQRVAGQAAPETVTNAVISPLYDVNILRTKIPEVLLDAVDSPYSLPNPMTCAEIAARVRPLDEALGPDLDMDSNGDDTSLIEKGHGAALHALGDAASGVIPMRGWVRRLSGAEQHDRYVRSVIVAGGVRRAYLKGLGQTLHCRPPAAPAPIALNHVAPGVYPPAEQKFQPKYPIR